MVEGRRVMNNSVRLAGTFTSPHVYPQALMQDGQVNILNTFFERFINCLWRWARWRLALAGSWSPILDREEKVHSLPLDSYPGVQRRENDGN